jgi:cell division protein FtsQ
MSWAEAVNSDHPFKTVILALLLLGLMLGALAGLDYLLRADTFPVRNVSFEGEFKRVQQRQLAEVVAERVSGNFFALDLDAVRKSAETVPWVHRVTVRRRWPDGVHIQFTEQQLAARWGDSAWLNGDGELVELRGQPGPEGLMLLDGPPGTQAEVLVRWRRLESIAQAHALGIARLRLTPRYTWEIELSDRLLLLAGRGAPDDKFARFMEVHGQATAGRTARIRHVDLRYTNGFVVQWNAPGTDINEG